MLSVYGYVVPGAGKGAVHGNKITGMLMEIPKRKKYPSYSEVFTNMLSNSVHREALRSCFLFDSDGKCQFFSSYCRVVPDTNSSLCL